jgi:hypothetical protein
MVRKILLVANQTAGGKHLRELVRERMAEAPSRFTLLVPASPPHSGLTWTESEAGALAEWRMNDALTKLRNDGAEIDGIVGDARPMDAIADVLRDDDFHEIILSTLPPGPSRWLKQDLPRRVGRTFGIPVTHVVGDAVVQADPVARVEAMLRPTGS